MQLLRDILILSKSYSHQLGYSEDVELVSHYDSAICLDCCQIQVV